MNWSTKTLEEIVAGKASDGSSLLQAFLIDYSKEFNNKKLQPSCASCLRQYYNNYKQKLRTMKSKCNYTLLPRFSGIPLRTGGPILLTNDNLTNERAEILISRYVAVAKRKGTDFDPGTMFKNFPKGWAKVQKKIAEENEKAAAEAQAEAQAEADRKKKEATEAQEEAATKATEAREAATKATEAREAEEKKQKAAEKARVKAEYKAEKTKGEAEAANIEATIASNKAKNATGEAEAATEAAKNLEVVETPVDAPTEDAPTEDAPTEDAKPDEALSFSELRAKYPEVKASSKTAFLEALKK